MDMENMGINKYIRIIAIVAFVLTLVGGTLAYWNWGTDAAQRTNVTFTVAQGFTCGADGGGDITSSDVLLAPASCNNPYYAIQREVTVSTTQDTGKEISLDMWLKVNSIGSGLAGTENFRYALTDSDKGCTNEMINDGNSNHVIAEGTFQGAASGTKFNLLENKEYLASTQADTYYLYIWLDNVETNQNTMNQMFSMTLEGSCTDELPEADAAFDGVYLVSTTDNLIGTAIGSPLVPTGVALRTTPTDAMADWQYLTGIPNDTRPLYLKHKVENGVITESYVEFVVTPEFASSHSGMIPGTYTLKGKTINDDLDSNIDSPYYLDNAKEIYRAFGSNSSLCNYEDPTDANFSSSVFGCSVAGLSASAYGYGDGIVNDVTTSYCFVGSSGLSDCGVY